MSDPPAPDGGDPIPPTWRDRIDLLTAGSPALTPARIAAMVAGGLAVLAVVAVVVLRPAAAPPPELTLPQAGTAGAPTSTTTTEVAPDVVAHAAGAVQAPGVYRLAAGSRVADLVTAAGGAVAGADVNRLNLAAVVADGERLYVPLVGEAVVVATGPAHSPDGTAGTDPGTGSAELVDLNAATATELEALPGVGPATAAAILEERGRKGRFDSVEELLDVSGIGDAKLEQLRDLVTV